MCVQVKNPVVEYRSLESLDETPPEIKWSPVTGIAELASFDRVFLISSATLLFLINLIAVTHEVQ